MFLFFIEWFIHAFLFVDAFPHTGVNAVDIAKLKAAGIHTIAAVLMQTSKTLEAIKGLSEAKVTKIVAAATKLQGMRVLYSAVTTVITVFHLW